MVATHPAKPGINNKALAWTIGVHALLLLLFFFFRYTLPVTNIIDEGGGMEVNLGTDENGSGNDQPMSRKDPAEYKATVVYKSAPAKASIPHDIVRTDNADAPEVNNLTKTKSTGKEETHEKSKATTPARTPLYLSGRQQRAGWQ